MNILLTEVLGETCDSVGSVRYCGYNLAESLGSYIACSINTLDIGSAVLVGDNIAACVAHKAVNLVLYRSDTYSDKYAVYKEREVFVVFYIAK